MTKDEIIRMAQEAAGKETVGASDMGDWDVIERFAALVAAAEREACAKLCEAEATIEGIAQRCADAIRARGEK